LVLVLETSYQGGTWYTAGGGCGSGGPTPDGPDPDLVPSISRDCPDAPDRPVLAGQAEGRVQQDDQYIVSVVSRSKHQCGPMHLDLFCVQSMLLSSQTDGVAHPRR